MTSTQHTTTTAAHATLLPKHRELYFGGAWHQPHGGYAETFNPATGASLGPCAEADAVDVDAAAKAAHAAFRSWRLTAPDTGASSARDFAPPRGPTARSWPRWTRSTAATRCVR